MASVNRVTLIGNLGRDPEMKTDTLCVCSMATTERWMDKQSDEWKSATEWHNLKAWRWAAEKLARCEKGWTVYIEGKIVTNKWTKEDGTEVDSKDIVVDVVKVLSKPMGQLTTEDDTDKADETAVDDEDLPF